MKEIPSKYAGQHLALIDEEIVASGKSYLEVFRTAKRLHPTKIITLEYFPTKRETITFL